MLLGASGPQHFASYQIMKYIEPALDKLNDAWDELEESGVLVGSAEWDRFRRTVDELGDVILDMEMDTFDWEPLKKP